MFLPEPRGFRERHRVEERLAMLDDAPAVQPLLRWSRALEAAEPGRVVPHFDPAEAGVHARILFVLEAPGPMTNASNARPGSGFVSVDNNDQTAENLWRARDEAGLSEGFLCWNIVPWYLGPASVKPTAGELAEGAAALVDLMKLLPSLETVVLAGRYAQNGWARHIASSLRRPVVDVVETSHPSPLALNQPGRRQAFVEALRELA